MLVVRCIQDHSDELEADLREFFTVDLSDLYSGRLTLRQLHVYIRSLLKKQGRSTLLTAVDERADWSVEAMLMARISDALELSNYMFKMAHTPEEEQDEIPVPVPVPRPGDPEPDAQELEFATGAEVAGFFNQLNS